MNEKSRPSKEDRFWRALAPATDSHKPEVQSPHIELTSDLSDLDAEQREERRQTLKSMLEVNQARHQDAKRNRRPTMEPGQRVAVISGQLMGKQGVVTDADFIKGRVQLDLDEMPELQWVSFKRVGPLQSAN